MLHFCRSRREPDELTQRLWYSIGCHRNTVKRLRIEWQDKEGRWSAIFVRYRSFVFRLTMGKAATTAGEKKARDNGQIIGHFRVNDDSQGLLTFSFCLSFFLFILLPIGFLFCLLIPLSLVCLLFSHFFLPCLFVCFSAGLVWGASEVSGCQCCATVIKLGAWAAGKYLLRSYCRRCVLRGLLELVAETPRHRLQPTPIINLNMNGTDVGILSQAEICSIVFSSP